VNVLQGRLFSTAFRVQDDEAFERDPTIVALRQYLDIYSGRVEDAIIHCIVSKDCQPRTKLRVARQAVMELLGDAKASDVVMDDDFGWLATLQIHLHPDDGIVVVSECDDGQQFQTYIARDCAGWTR